WNPQRQSLKHQHSMSAANSIGPAVTHPANNRTIGGAHPRRPASGGMAVGTQTMHDAALEPAPQRLLIAPAARLRDAAGGHLHQATQFDQRFNLARFMQ